MIQQKNRRHKRQKQKQNTTLLEKFDDPTEQSSTQEAKTIPPTQTHERSLSWLNWYTHFK
jgi:hypothetical protein